MGIFDRLFRRTAKSKSGSIAHDEAIRIINAYAKALADRKSSYGDPSELPYPKERIKQALIYGIQFAEDSAVREHLKPTSRLPSGSQVSPIGAHQRK